MTDNSPVKNTRFTEGGGEMGELIRNKNWGNTALGDPACWPQSLRTMVAVMLNNSFGMYIAWGPDYIQLYNDAYRPILGSTKHPQALGISTRQTFAEIWETIGPMFDDVMKGIPVGLPDFMLPINRNGFVEECFFDFSYCPIPNDDGQTGGVLVTVLETTAKKKVLDDLAESEHRFRAMADNIPNLAWMADATGWIYWYNKKWYEYTGTTIEQMEGWGWQTVHHPDELDNVVNKWQGSIKNGEPFEMVFPIKGADGRFRQFLTRVLPLKNEYGVIQQWFGTNTDITRQKETEKVLKESQERFLDTVKQAPVGITILRGRDYIVELANDAYLLLVNKTMNEVVGRPLFDSLPEVEESVHALLDNVYDTGTTYYGIEYPIPVNRFGKLEVSHFNFVYHPLREMNGEISGIIVTGTDVSQQVAARVKIEESDQKLRSMVSNAPFPIGVYEGRSMRIALANEAMLKTWGKGNDVMGKMFSGILPELSNQEIFNQLDEVFTTGIAFHATNKEVDIVVEGRLQTFYFNYSLTPLHDLSGTVYGVMHTAADVTDLNVAKQKVEESDLFNRTIFESSPDCVKVLDLGGLISFININGVCALEGENKAYFINREWYTMWGDENKQLINDAVRQAKLGVASEFDAFATTVKGTPKWWHVSVTPLVDSQGKVFSILATSRDTTSQKKHEQELTESEQKFRLLADSMPQHIWTSDTEGNLNYFNKSVFDFSGLTPAQIKKDGWLQIVHPGDRKANIKAWTTAIRTGKDFLLEHRFRRYDGTYRWQLSRAIAQKDSTGKTQMWVGSSTDIQEQKMFTEELEKQVEERTGELLQKNIELQTMNKELQSFAYISSHDLQEPLRKIQTFASRLLQNEYDNLSVAGKDQFERMQNAARRMQTLIDDLLAYSRTSNPEKKYELLNLGIIVDEVTRDLKEELEQKQATIQSGQMCDVKIIPFQFRQLLHNLISNALKFSLPQHPPVITITSHEASGRTFNNPRLAPNETYCHISVADNGIGFEQEYAEKIFELFQRLHGRTEYTGTGIGLAIVKKIVENHNGTITAHSAAGEGATFDIYLPASISYD